MGFPVELALDRAEFPGSAFLGHEVNADVADMSLLRPFVPHPNAGESLRVERVEFQIPADQPLEAVAQIPVRPRLFAEFLKNRVDRDRRGRFWHTASHRIKTRPQSESNN